MSTALAHKIALDPTLEQQEFFQRLAGTARSTWNWALAEWQERYRHGDKPNGNLLKKAFNALRRELLPWTYEVHRDATARPFADLQHAFINFFQRPPVHPKFKKKRRCRDAFYRQRANANRQKARRRVTRLHACVAHIRTDALHKLTSTLCRENQAISIEDLHVKGLIKNTRLARSISDMGWGECRRQLAYKAPLYRAQLYIVGRLMPSSKMCNHCKTVNPVLTLGDSVMPVATSKIET